MSEEVKDTALQEETTVDKPQEQTQQQAATVDIDAIVKQASQKAEENAQKKMEAVFKSMLQQQGLDADTIAKMTEEWKASQVTPEKELEEVRGQLSGKDAEIASLKQDLAMRAKAIPEDKVGDYKKLALAYMDENTDFAEALDKALTAFPIQKETPPPYAAGTGSGSMALTPDKVARMSYKEQLAFKQSNPEQYKKIFNKGD